MARSSGSRSRKFMQTVSTPSSIFFHYCENEFIVRRVSLRSIPSCIFSLLFALFLQKDFFFLPGPFRLWIFNENEEKAMSWSGRAFRSSVYENRRERKKKKSSDMRSEALAMNFEAIEENSLIFQSDNNNSGPRVWKTDVEEAKLGSGLMCFRQKKRREKLLSLFTSKGRTTSGASARRKKSGRYVHSSGGRKGKKTGSARSLSIRQKAKSWSKGRWRQAKKKPCKLLLRSLEMMSSANNNSRCGNDKMESALWSHAINQLQVHVGRLRSSRIFVIKNVCCMLEA